MGDGRPGAWGMGLRARETQGWLGQAGRGLTASGTLALLLMAGGCAFFMPDKIHHVVPPPEPPEESCRHEGEAAPGGRMIGLALSGGGLRAAVFAAASLEALAEHGVLDEVTHLSSVSGGSFAAGYYLANPPTCHGIADTGEEQACWRAYFATFKQQMRANYWNRMFLRNTRPWRFSSPTRRAVSLQEILDKRFLHGRTFAELPDRPVLLLNATNSDETRRFVFSNACLAEEGPQAPAGGGAMGGPGYRSMAADALAKRTVRAHTFSRPGCTRAVPGDLPVSLAVVASAAFPPLVGPISIQAPSGCDGEPQWWHIGDGGIVENAGTDGLEEILLRRLSGQGPPLEQILILSLDAGTKHDAENLKSQRKFNMYRGLKTRLVVDSPRARGQAYHDLFWRDLEMQMKAGGIDYQKIALRYGTAALETLPASCAKDLAGPEAIAAHLPGIPTNYKITPCNADLLEQAAHHLVHALFASGTARGFAGDGRLTRAHVKCGLER